MRAAVSADESHTEPDDRCPRLRLPSATFRLGTTSALTPGTVVENVRRVADRVDDVELVLFELPTGETNLPSEAAVAALAAIADDHGLSYTVHLPSDLRWVASGQQPALERGARVIDRTARLRPAAYVAHLDQAGLDQPGWHDQALRAIDWVVARLDRPAQLAVENLESYAPEQLEPVLLARPVSHTLDIGHLWKSDRDPVPWLTRWLPRASVLHLHGYAQTDHRSLAVMPPERLAPILAALRDWSGIVTLEVFEWADLLESYQVLAAVWARLNSHANSAGDAG